MTSELKLSRRSVLFGAGAVALTAALLPRDVREVWYHHGVPDDIELVVVDDPGYEWRLAATGNRWGRIGEYRLVRVAKHIGRAHVG